MVIYVDVLIATNSIVNYFLLLTAAKLDRRDFGSLRIILSAILGGVFSLYILFQIESTLIDLLVKAVCCFLMVLTAFGYKNPKNFIRSSFYLFTASFIFAGVMMLFCSAFKNDVIIVNNSTVYFNISVVMLIIAAVLIYLLISVILFFTHKKALKDKICKISVEFDGQCANLDGLFDTGNSLTDNFSDNAVVLVDRKAFLKQSNLSEDYYRKRYRILPCETVNGSDVLEGFRADKMRLSYENGVSEYDNPLIMFSKTALKDGIGALINTEIIER